MVSGIQICRDTDGVTTGTRCYRYVRFPLAIDKSFNLEPAVLRFTTVNVDI